MDGGKTFGPASSQQLIVNSIAISSSNPDLLYIGCGGSNNSYTGIYKSTDAGITWEEKTRGLPRGKEGKPAFAVTGVKIDAANQDIVYAALYRNGIYVSLDGGNYWTCAGLSDYILFDVNSGPAAARAADSFKQKGLHAEPPLFHYSCGHCQRHVQVLIVRHWFALRYYYCSRYREHGRQRGSVFLQRKLLRQQRWLLFINDACRCA